MKNKLLGLSFSFVLALCLCLGLFTAGALADTSGTCGDDVNWVLDEAGLLTISGNGAMAEYTTGIFSRSPFYQNTEIRRAVIEPGVTTVAGYLFYGCTGLESVSIPDSVQQVGQYAFYQCSSLQSLAIPEGVTEIGPFFCNECTAMTSLSLPSTVESIGNYAFWKCSGLTGTLTLPASLKTVGTGAFYTTGYDTLAIPAGVTEIGDSAFSFCKGLTEIRFPAAMREDCILGKNAFSSCSGLTSVTIPMGVTELGESAFSTCRGLLRITLPEGLRTIGPYAFGWCDALTEINIPDGVTTISQRAFSGCSSLAHATIPASVQSIGGLAFINCQKAKLYILGANTVIEEATLNSEQVTDFFNPNKEYTGTIYCIQGSPADALARERGYAVRYIDPETGLESVREVETEYAFLRLPLGKVQEMCASLYPPVENATFTWRTDAPEIVSLAVSAEDSTVCVATALATGTAHVTISSEYTSTVTDIAITVYQPVEDFELSATLWVFQGDSAQLEIVNVTPANAEGEMTWRSSDGAVATVDQSGLVTGHAPGEATIFARFGEVERSTVVHVNAPLDALYFDFEVMAINKGRATQLFSDLPWLEEHSVNHLAVFQSADDQVASVDQLGWVTGRGCGITTIRVTAYNDPDVYAECTVVVLSSDPLWLVLPNGLKKIEDEAFSGIGHAEIVRIPEGCAVIGADAFAGCDTLLLAFLPGDIAIDDTAFDGCGEWVFICPQDENSRAAAYAAGKHMKSFAEILWISEEDSIPAETDL